MQTDRALFAKSVNSKVDLRNKNDISDIESSRKNFKAQVVFSPTEESSSSDKVQLNPATLELLVQSFWRQNDASKANMNAIIY